MSDTVIVLQEDCILAATGKPGRKPRISTTNRLDLSFRGELFEQWKEALTIWKGESYKGGSIKLVLPSIYASSRIHRIPYAKGRQLKQLADHVAEAEDSEKISDYGICDSDKHRGITLCHASVEPETLQEILNIFNSLDLPVAGVTVLMESYLKVLSKLKEAENKTAIYLFFEDSGVTSLLYQEGNYLYSTRSRIFSERGTLDFETEIVRNLSGIKQFYATTSPGGTITDVFYAGCREDDFEVCLPGIQSLNIEPSPLNVDGLCDIPVGADAWLPCIGAMMEDKGGQINLLSQWNLSQTKEGGGQKNLLKHLLYPGICLGACLVIFAGIFAWNFHKRLEINEVEDWINDPEISQSYEEAYKKKTDSDKLTEAMSQVQQMKDNLATYPDLDQETLATIMQVGGSNMDVMIKSMDAKTGLLTFQAESADVIDIPSYINKLNQTGLFSSVDYTGYQYDDGTYSLDLSCILAAENAGGDK